MTSQFWADVQETWTYDVMCPIYVNGELFGSMELFFRDIKALTELFDGMKPRKVLPQDKEYEEETVARIGNDDIRKDSMGVFTAVTEYAHDAEILFLFSARQEVNDGSAIIIVDVAVSGTSTDGTCFQLGLKLLHVGVKKRF